jgi:hypothetical protein
MRRGGGQFGPVSWRSSWLFPPCRNKPATPIASVRRARVSRTFANRSRPTVKIANRIGNAARGIASTEFAKLCGVPAKRVTPTNSARRKIALKAFAGIPFATARHALSTKIAPRESAFAKSAGRGRAKIQTGSTAKPLQWLHAAGH